MNASTRSTLEKVRSLSNQRVCIPTTATAARMGSTERFPRISRSIEPSGLFRINQSPCFIEVLMNRGQNSVGERTCAYPLGDCGLDGVAPSAGHSRVRGKGVESIALVGPPATTVAHLLQLEHDRCGVTRTEERDQEAARSSRLWRTADDYGWREASGRVGTHRHAARLDAAAAVRLVGASSSG